MAASPTQLTLRYLREQGWPLVAVVEHWNPFAKIRQDLFGFGDVLAVRPGRTLAVQTTTASHAPDRVRKIRDHPHVDAVRDAGWEIRVHGWEKKAGRWVLQRDIDLTHKETTMSKLTGRAGAVEIDGCSFRVESWELTHTPGGSWPIRIHGPAQIEASAGAHWITVGQGAVAELHQSGRLTITTKETPCPSST